MAKTILFPFESGVVLTASIVPLAGGTAIHADTVTDVGNEFFEATFDSDPSLAVYRFTASNEGLGVFAGLVTIGSDAINPVNDLLGTDVRSIERTDGPLDKTLKSGQQVTIASVTEDSQAGTATGTWTFTEPS